MEEVRDPRFRRLSTVGAILNFLVAIIALVAAVSYHWANLSGTFFGYLGPFRVCEDVPAGSDRCLKGGAGPYRTTWAGYVSGIAAILCLVFLGIGAMLGPLVVTMHQVQHHICLKFRHATFTRMIVSSGAALSSLISVVCFMLEVNVFIPMQTDNLRTEMSWSFYLEIVAFIGSILIGIIASYEWNLSRKVGGDPTVYSRDPEGSKADTIVNPNFRDGPRKGFSPHKGGSSNAPKGHSGAPRSQGVHRNSNGVAMTQTSGLPYMVTNGIHTRSQNGHVPNGRHPLIAFDPNRTPLRSSLRRPKVTTEDTSDGGDLALQNPSFANTSPPLKKKVRIHTQSTAV